MTEAERIRFAANALNCRRQRVDRGRDCVWETEPRERRDPTQSARWGWERCLRHGETRLWDRLNQRSPGRVYPAMHFDD